MQTYTVIQLGALSKDGSGFTGKGRSWESKEEEIAGDSGVVAVTRGRSWMSFIGLCHNSLHAYSTGLITDTRNLIGLQ